MKFKYLFKILPLLLIFGLLLCGCNSASNINSVMVSSTLVISSNITSSLLSQTSSSGLIVSSNISPTVISSSNTVTSKPISSKPASSSYQRIETDINVINHYNQLIKGKTIAGNNVQKAFVVATYGDDTTGDGSINKPFKTVYKARDAVRAYLSKNNLTGDVIVYIRKGTYFLDKTFQLLNSDSGKNGKNVVYTTFGAENVTLSGGISVKGWSKKSGKNYYKANISGIDYIRQLYIDGQRMKIASTENPIKGVGWYDDANTSERKDGFKCNSGDVPNLANPADAELHWQVQWRDFFSPVDHLADVGNGHTAIAMKQPTFGSAVNILTNPSVPFDVKFTIVNDISLLDQPGEWYYNRKEKTIYYLPLSGQDMNKVSAIVPKTDQLLDIRGSGFSNKIQNIYIANINFAYSSWTEPSKDGWFGYQSDCVIAPSNNLPADSLTFGTIQVSSANNINFIRNTFKHIGSAAMNLIEGVYNSNITGNVFQDISATGITIGTINDYRENDDYQVCRNNTISNNVINKIGAEYFGACGIQAFYVESLNINHNDVSNTPYTGIAVGWMKDTALCKNNSITNNRIYDVVKVNWDGGGIYTFSPQPGSVCSNNYIKDVHNNFAGLYFDERTSGYTSENNVIENAPNWLYIWTNSINNIIIRNNYTNTSTFINKGTNITIENTSMVFNGNWPQAAKSIMDNSGLTSSYSDLQSHIQ